LFILLFNKQIHHIIVVNIFIRRCEMIDSKKLQKYVKKQIKSILKKELKQQVKKDIKSYKKKEKAEKKSS